MLTVFLSILSQIEFHLVQNRKENRHHDHIPFNRKGNENKVFSVQYLGHAIKKSFPSEMIHSQHESLTLIRRCYEN